MWVIKSAVALIASTKVSVVMTSDQLRSIRHSNGRQNTMMDSILNS